MTRDKLSTEESCFATGIDSSDKVLPSPELPRELTLDAYLDSRAHDESWVHPSADPRRLAFEHILQKLSRMEIIGKEYVEGYLRHQYRSHFQSNTLRNTYTCLIPFLRFIQGRGKRVIEDVDKGDLEAFIEHEQDRGLKVSTVKLMLAKTKAFLRY
ncbi:MAG: site-specific integrase, partial [Candidatus Hodarchaeales archaeon]